MKKKGIFSTIAFALVFLVGLSLLLYPSFSNYWNRIHSGSSFVNYTEAVADLDDNTYEEALKAARKYNKKLRNMGDGRFSPSKEDDKTYRRLLDISDNGMMGSVLVPSIGVELPIYHGTDDAVLDQYIGHIEGSSLPVGGKSTHTVLSGHRGLPSAKLFTDIDQLTEGDIFMIHVLDETLTYEVDQINVVLPNDTSKLEIEKGQDLCTLITCTPYGVNTHRLLVRGHRIPNLDGEGLRIPADATQIDKVLFVPFAAVPTLLILILIITIIKRYKNKKRRKKT